MAEAKEKPHLDSTRLKRFIVHLATASQHVENKHKAKQKVEEHVERLKFAVNEGAPKKDISDALSHLEDSLKHILHDEEAILESQKLETKTVSELRDRLDGLNEKLVLLAKDYAEELSEKDEHIENLHSQLSVAHATISEHEADKDDRRERLAVVEEKINEHHEEKKRQSIKEMSSKLKELEKTHKKLEKSGQHPKTKLNKLKKMIDTHKQTLVDMKKK